MENIENRASKQGKDFSEFSVAPEPEEFSYFYRHDDVKCQISNIGVPCEASGVPFIRAKELNQKASEEKPSRL